MTAGDDNDLPDVAELGVEQGDLNASHESLQASTEQAEQHGAKPEKNEAIPVETVASEAQNRRQGVEKRSSSSEDSSPRIHGKETASNEDSRPPRRSLTNPNLSVDTALAAVGRGSLHWNTQRSSLRSSSPMSQLSQDHAQTSPPLPVSPRTRGRGFSLRRSVLSRSAHSQTQNDSDAALEPDFVEGSSAKSQSRGVNVGNLLLPHQNLGSSLPAAQRNDIWDHHSDSMKKEKGSISLPNYEKWAKEESTARRIRIRLKDTKESIRKTILRIQELPASKHGRRVPLDLSKRKPLVDDRRGSEYISNTIRSTRHTLYNFLPRQLFAQFYKLANFYFLCVSILQMIPGLSTTGHYTTIVPLLFFVSISIAKEGYDDLRRYKLDKAENRRMTAVLCVSKDATDASDKADSVTYEGLLRWEKIKWENVKVGDVVKLERNDASPADLVILQAQGTEGVAYIETMALDGETNLKTKQPSPLFANLRQKPEDIANCKAEVVAEDPNLDLYNFEGKVTLADETLPLTNSEIIYRGSVLRNTSQAVGLVLNSGEECKIRMNATKNPRIKAPALQFAVNRVVVIIVIFVIVLAIFNTVAYQVWRDNTEDEAWYLTNAGVAFFPILASFIILFNTMIPLSLYVSLEIVKLCQMFLMNDVDMYDEQSNTPMEARTSSINEELGQVNYIFSDKTGTLTNNSMRFRKMSVAGTAWLHDTDVPHETQNEGGVHSKFRRDSSKGKAPVRQGSTASPSSPHIKTTEFRRPSESTIRRTSSVNPPWRSSARPQSTRMIPNTVELIKYIQQHPHTGFSRKATFFILSLALCHTCFPETDEKGEITYQAASPDEQALVQAAQELGYIVVDRQNATINIKVKPAGDKEDGVLSYYKVLNIIEFSSARKRMSIVVRMPNQRICVFCKGADSTIIPLLRLSKLAYSKAVEVEQKANKRQSLEAQHALRRASEARSRKDSLARKSLSIHRPSMGGLARPSLSGKKLQPIRDEVDRWLNDRERDIELSSAGSENACFSSRPSAQLSPQPDHASHSFDGRISFQRQPSFEVVDESMVSDDPTVFERCFQHVNDFSTEGLRTLLYGYRYLDDDEYQTWHKLYHDATTSLTDRQEQVEKVGALLEHDLELAGATAIEDKLQDGVPEAIEKLRRAGIKLWMLTGDKRETAINIGHSCRLIRDYSTVTVLDRELGDVSQSMAAGIVNINKGNVAHSVVVIDGQTLGEVNASDSLRRLFLSLAILVDTVVCCRASPSQKASLVHSIRRKVKHAVTLAIGDGANDIAMIQEAHVGIGITGKEGLQAARTSDYSIAQFRFLTKLLLVHGRWNYVRTCKYTLGTFWKEMLFYLTQALFQRYAGYTGTSLYEQWSLSMFNTLFTSLPVIFLGIFEQDLSPETLMAVPELYQSEGPRNAGFNIPLYLGWIFMAASNAVIVFFLMLGLYGQALFTLDNGLFAMGALSYSSSVIVIAAKLQFWELHNKTITCAISMFLSIGGWFLWNMILSRTYHNDVIYNVKDGFLTRFGRNGLWWLTLILILSACWALEIGIKALKCTWLPSDADCFRELEKDSVIRERFAQASGLAVKGRQPDLQDGTSLSRMRSPEEEHERETTVQEILNRPRHMKIESGTGAETTRLSDLKRRRTLDEDPQSPREPKVSFAVSQKDFARKDETDDNDGRQRPRRRSTEVSEMLKKGFGSVRRSLDT